MVFSIYFLILRWPSNLLSSSCYCTFWGFHRCPSQNSRNPLEAPHETSTTATWTRRYHWCLDVKHGRYFWWVFHMGLSVKKWDMNGNTLWFFMGHLTNYDSTWHQIMWKPNEHEVLNHWILRYSTLFQSNPVFLGHLRSTSYLVSHEWDDESWCIWHMVLYDLGLSTRNRPL